MMFPKLPRKIQRPALPRDDGYGKRFTFNTAGETTFQNFTASEIIAVLTAMQGGGDGMSARFGDGR